MSARQGRRLLALIAVGGALGAAGCTFPTATYQQEVPPPCDPPASCLDLARACGEGARKDQKPCENTHDACKNHPDPKACCFQKTSERIAGCVAQCEACGEGAASPDAVCTNATAACAEAAGAPNPPDGGL